ncbi:MAG: hypothetical protein U5R31_09195 [Acidimicrobiia bacterium]|nr:hypothetical protein [Acidimicrobiia bacterium]
MSRLAERSRRAAALLMALRSEGLWPPAVPSVVVVESVVGHAGHDARTNRLLKACRRSSRNCPSRTARRAARLRARAGRGSAVDAVVVTIADPGGSVLASDTGDLGALAEHATDVSIEPA